MLFSIAANLLLLVAPIYMLQVYDRVLASGSRDTLMVISGIALFLLVILGSMEAIRQQVLSRTASTLDDMIAGAAFKASLADSSAKSQATSQPLADLETLRQFLGSRSVLIFFDALFTPFFLLLVYLVHPFLGITLALAGAVIFLLALMTDRMTRAMFAKAGGYRRRAENFLSSSLANHEVLRAMRIADGIQSQWQAARKPGLEASAVGSERIQVLNGVSKAFRMSVQIIMLGGGAWLALEGEISAGAIVAASIIGGRALAPIDQAIGSWRSVVQAREAYHRMQPFLAAEKPENAPIALPRPEATLDVINLVGSLPTVKDPILLGVHFSLEPGEVVGVLGPSGAGKSFLCRHLVGVAEPAKGEVRLGGIEMSGWADEDRGNYVGYLPQSIELFPGTIAQNICRFGEADEEKILAAAKLAHCHELILSLPDTYQHALGQEGGYLSGGQSQRIALARAVYDNPALLVLDEPDSNLDQEGERALATTIHDIAKTGTSVVMVTHNIRLLQVAQKVLVLHNGRMEHFGLRDDVLQEVAKPAEPSKAAEPDKANDATGSHAATPADSSTASPAVTGQEKSA